LWDIWLLAHAGRFAGGQAEYVRVPFADVGTIKIPNGLADEQVLFLSDIFPTGYMAAEQCEIKPATRSQYGVAAPVGQFAIRSAYCLGRARDSHDRFPERLRMAEGGGARRLTISRLMSMTLSWT